MTEPAEVTTKEAPATEPVVEAESSEPEDTSVLDTLDYEDLDEDEPVEVTTTEPEPEKEIEEDKVIKSAGEILAGKEEKKEPEVKATEPKETPVEPDKSTEPVAATEVVKATEPIATEPAKPTEPAPSPEEVRTSVLEQMEKSYQFSEEDANLVRIEPEKALPKLAARLFVDIYEAISHGVYTQLPTIINTLSEQRASSTKHEGSFFEAFPELNKPEYAEQLGRTGKFWRDQNPDATAEQAVQGIGTTAMAMLGLTKVEVPVVETPPAVKPIPPSVPAAAASGAGDTPKVESNEILDMLDFTEDDI